jgi:hypothetical protein
MGFSPIGSVGAIGASAAPAPSFNVGKLFTSIASAISRNIQQSVAAERRANQLEFDAAIANANAASELSRAEQEKKREERRNRASEAALRVKLLQGGILLEGSPLLVTEQEVAENALKAEDIKHQGEVRAARFRQQAAKSQFAADNARASVGFSLL